MKNTFKKLTKEETNRAYKTINSVAYHLANTVSDAPSDPLAKRAKYFEVQNLLKRAFLVYDRVEKVATPIQDLATLEKYKTVKRFPKALTVAPKTSPKKKATSKRI